jgi:hypothetical protein
MLLTVEGAWGRAWNGVVPGTGWLSISHPCPDALKGLVLVAGGKVGGCGCTPTP